MAHEFDYLLNAHAALVSRKQQASRAEAERARDRRPQTPTTLDARRYWQGKIGEAQDGLHRNAVAYITRVISEGPKRAEGVDVASIDEVVSAAEAYHAAKALSREPVPLPLPFIAERRAKGLSDAKERLEAALESYIWGIVAEQLKAKGAATV